MANKPKCNKCGQSDYIERYDRYACLNCNEWVESPCGCDERDCEFVPCPDTPKEEELQASVVYEIYTAVERLGGNFELLAIIGSWGDTMDDETTLAMLRDFNTHGTAIKEVICQIER